MGAPPPKRTPNNLLFPSPVPHEMSCLPKIEEPLGFSHILGRDEDNLARSIFRVKNLE